MNCRFCNINFENDMDAISCESTHIIEDVKIIKIAIENMKLFPFFAKKDQRIIEVITGLMETLMDEFNFINQLTSRVL
jgi:hypothetical protein